MKKYLPIAITVVFALGLATAVAAPSAAAMTLAGTVVVIAAAVGVVWATRLNRRSG